MDYYDELDAKNDKLIAALYRHGSILDLVPVEVLVSTISVLLSNMGPFYEILQFSHDHTSLWMEEEQFVCYISTANTYMNCSTLQSTPENWGWTIPDSSRHRSHSGGGFQPAELFRA